MNWLVIEGMKPYDGRYEFDLDNELTTREWGWIKRLSGYLPLTISDGLEGVDPELLACLAVLMVRRAGKIANPDVQDLFDRISDAPFGTTIRLETDDEETEADDAGPPAQSSSGNEPSSGDGSPANSESSGPPLNGTGTPDSASSAFEQLTSGS